MIFYQVNRILYKPHIINKFLRNVHTETTSSSNILYPLKSRGLLKVTGDDASVFLQGLITNDMNHFEEGTKSMYAMFLNNKGRVLYDTLIHKWNKEESFLIECDRKLVNVLQKHLKLYKLKRKVNIEDVNDEYLLYALKSTNVKDVSNEKINVYKDPRLTELGYRVISSVDVKDSDVAQTVGNDVVTESNEDGYKYLRYKLGVSEGADDLPPGTSFPLEANCDYLHGVSFHKGCYIGQELTARVHHTGVVRKRIMPLKFNETISNNIERDSVISASSNPKSNLGKLKGVVNNYGLGLLRIKEALDAKILSVANYSAEAQKPAWWPIEAPKELLKSE
ncbi:putative transferase CAF17 homolog, mitochondrial [Pararge aegeria]|uniref:Jg10245 protein n=1 Tax=Pararge aegeria aegeria TaxID=348720 RepID=A0A8S4S5I1_9NEOP|nr:putative transferase CAF17 homolog, mitochondrial [Pararge aegeria]CAH2250893.1 jg10245 [Pararge aegeria aegeria]